MFCAIYRFTVQPDHDDQFRQHWLAVTQYLYQHAGSLGSRLHRANPREYIGYAQWPSRHVWEHQRDRADVELQAYRQAMRASCEEIEALYEMDVMDDWLQRDVYGGVK
jgi:quinol monooxygenase YgiN